MPPTQSDSGKFLERVLVEVQDRVREDQYRAWFRDLSLLHLEADSAEFGVRTVFVRDWLTRNYMTVIEESVAAAAGATARVKVSLDHTALGTSTIAEPEFVAVAPVGVASAAGEHASEADELPHARQALSTLLGSAAGGSSAEAKSTPAESRRAFDARSQSRPAPELDPLEDVDPQDVDPHGDIGAAPALDSSSPSQPSTSRPEDVVRDHEEESFETIIEGSGLSTKYTFEHFVQGPSNHLAHAAAIAVGENPGCAYNPLYVHGSVGLGKTHLLQATCHAILRRRRVARVSYQSCEDFTNRYIRAVQDKALDEFRAIHRSVDVLVIDDVQFLASKERTQEEFFHTFNALRNEGCQIVISSDCSPSEIPQLQERLVSRFKWGLVVEIEAPNFDTRVSIAKRKARLLGHEMGDEVASLIAERVDKNIRELEGAVIKVISMSQLMNRPLDTDLVIGAMRDVPVQRSTPVSWDDIMGLVTEDYSVTKRDILGKGRTQSISLPRQIAMYLTRDLTDLSYEEIGRKFGNRDHTTVLYAVQKLSKRVKDDRRFRETIESLRMKLRVT